MLAPQAFGSSFSLPRLNRAAHPTAALSQTTLEILSGTQMVATPWAILFISRLRFISITSRETQGKYIDIDMSQHVTTSPHAPAAALAAASLLACRAVQSLRTGIVRLFGGGWVTALCGSTYAM